MFFSRYDSDCNRTLSEQEHHRMMADLEDEKNHLDCKWQRRQEGGTCKVVEGSSGKWSNARCTVLQRGMVAEVAHAVARAKRRNVTKHNWNLMQGACRISNGK